MEVGPVDAPVVPLQHVLHHGVRLAEQVGGVGVSLDLILEAWKSIHVSYNYSSQNWLFLTSSAGSRSHGLLPEAGDVPHPDQ